VEKQGYRQSELARHVGVHYSTISSWLRDNENARRKT
jgi:transposase